MFKRLMALSVAGLMLAGCQQPTGPSFPQAYVVYFNTGQSTLSPEANATVAQAAATFRQGGTAVAVRGHTDTVGNPAYNMQLSRQRAMHVKEALVRDGVPASAILSGGLGEQSLPVPTADNVPERRNRSVDIAISRQPLMGDVEYCQALSTTYRRYRPGNIDETASRAMSMCPTDPATAIPILEDHLETMKVPLPSRLLARN